MKEFVRLVSLADLVGPIDYVRFVPEQTFAARLRDRSVLSLGQINQARENEPEPDDSQQYQE